MKKFLLLSFMLMFAFAFSESWAQERTVSGKVTSIEDGSTLPGVNVVLKGTTTGTVTDIDGNFKLSVPSDGGTLVFSFIGLATEEVEIGARSVIDLQMSPDVQQLSEVVVTGYGIERSANQLTYQAEKVKSETLMQGQQQIAAVGLTGKVAGLQINVQNNGVNPSAQILLRGMRSISANNEAMIVIDGAVATTSAFNDLNPQDIESIDVLKGANAGALYGSRAANGAIIVQTKKGKKGQAFTVGVNTSLTFEQVAFLPDFQTENGIGWDGHYDPIENTNWGPRFDGQDRLVGPDFPDSYPVKDQYLRYGPIENNLLDFYETGTTFQNTAYFSGGDETSTFYVSVGNTRTNGIVPNDRYERNTFRANATKKIGKLSLGLNSTYFEDDTDIVGSSIGDQDRTLYWFILNTQSNIPITEYKDYTDPLSYGYADNYYNAYYQNPYWAIGTNRNTDLSNRILANINGTYEINDKFSVAGRIGINRSAGTGKDWRDAQEYSEELQPAAGPVQSFLRESEFQNSEINGNLIFNYAFDLSSDIKMDGYLGSAFIDTDNRNSVITATNLSIPGFYDISNGTSTTAVVDQFRKRVYGYFGSVSFHYKDWANLDLAGRQDYTSTLPSDNNGYFYPSVSTSVILSNAIPSITDNNILSFAKITLSNSTVYNDLGAFALNERYSTQSTATSDQQSSFFPLGTVNGFEQGNTTVDASISKEKLNTWEVGMNLGLFNDRIQLNGSYFSTKTTDLITYTTPSYASGARSFLTNIGQLTSTGFEMTIAGTVLKVGDFAWETSLNYTTYETVVDEIKEGLDEIAVDNYGTYGTYAIVGKAFPQIKAQSYVRDDQGRVVIDPATGNPLVGEVEAHGKTTPDYILGMTNKLKYKGISVSATMDYRTGHVFFSQGHNSMEFTGKSIESISAERRNFIFPNSSYEEVEGSGVYVANTNIPISGGVMGFWQNSFNDIKENYIRDASAFKIREVAVNYALPTSLLQKTGFVKKLTVGFVARNLLTVLADGSKFNDPEFRNTRNTDDANGIGIGGYLQSPATRSFGFNLNVEF